MSDLNGIVNMYLDYADNQAKRNKLMAMADWVKKLDAFLQFNEYEIHRNSEHVSREVADVLAHEEYKSKIEFLSRMSHEMCTPMNAMIGITGIAKGSDDMQSVQYCLDKINNASKGQEFASATMQEGQDDYTQVLVVDF